MNTTGSNGLSADNVFDQPGIYVGPVLFLVQNFLISSWVRVRRLLFPVVSNKKASEIIFLANTPT